MTAFQGHSLPSRTPRQNSKVSRLPGGSGPRAPRAPGSWGFLPGGSAPDPRPAGLRPSSQLRGTAQQAPVSSPEALKRLCWPLAYRPLRGVTGCTTPRARPVHAEGKELNLGQSPHIRTSLSGVEAVGVTAAVWQGISVVPFAPGAAAPQLRSCEIRRFPAGTSRISLLPLTRSRLGQIRGVRALRLNCWQKRISAPRRPRESRGPCGSGVFGSFLLFARADNCCTRCDCGTHCGTITRSTVMVTRRGRPAVACQPGLVVRIAVT